MKFPLSFLAILFPLAASDCGVYDRIVFNPKSDHTVGNPVELSAGQTTCWWAVDVQDTEIHGGNRDDCSGTFNLGPVASFRDDIKKKVGKGRCPGRYEMKRFCMIDNDDDVPTNTTHSYTWLYIKDTEDKNPYHFFTKEVVRKLIKHQYLYLHMSHYFKSSDYYLPNVASFFRGYTDRALEIAEKAIKYTLDKKETLALVHGVEDRENDDNHAFHDAFDFNANSHSHSASFFPMQLELTNTFTPTGSTDYVKQAFQQAVHWEKTINAELTKALKKADDICDTELAEYIGAEMMPGQREALKLLESHKQTLKSMGEGRLQEFIFDSQL